MLNMRETIPEVFRAMEKQVYKDICKYDVFQRLNMQKT